MGFLSAKPNLSGNDKARIEFHLQQILDCVGLPAAQLPVVQPQSWLTPDCDIQRLAKLSADHLSHDISDLRIEVSPQQLEKCGGGG